MAEWTITQPIDYSPNGDDIDTFSQKVKYTLEQIYLCLQQLHANGSQAGLEGTATPYEIRIDTTTNHIYMRDPYNTDWILLGAVADHFGITPESVEAVRNGGGVGKVMCGKEINKPVVGNVTNDIYVATDTSTAYVWAGQDWKTLFSLNFANMLNYENYCVLRNEVSSVGGIENAGKVLRLDSITGKANTDITGSPERLADYPIEVRALSDGDVLAFDVARSKFINVPMSSGSGGGGTVSPVSGSGVNSSEVNHLKRVIEEMHMALAISALDSTGYDSMAIETFNNPSITDQTEVTLSFISQNRDEATVAGGDFDKVFSLIVGGNYKLVGNGYSQDVKIESINVSYGQAYLRFTEVVRFPFVNNSTKLQRSASSNITNGKFATSATDTVSIVTTPVLFINKMLNSGERISTAHLNVKHQNVQDAEILAQVALINNAKFMSGEVVGIGTGANTDVTLTGGAVQLYGFKLYFNGEEQSKTTFVFSTDTRTLTFNAPSGSVVTVDYYYDWGEEVFRPMTKSGVYCDTKNNSRATTQFTYNTTDTSRMGYIATLRLSIAQVSGSESNRYLGVGTGASQGFKVPHHAVENSIQVLPSTATWSWKDNLDVLVVTSPQGQTTSVSYNYLGKPFSVDSFAVMFNE